METREKMERRPEERKGLDEEELRLRDETLSRTPSDSDRSKTESGIYAPEGGGQGMVPVSSEKSQGAEERTQDIGEKTEETAKRIKSSDLGGR